MYAARAAKPKLSLSISTTTQSTSRPVLSLRSPGPAMSPRTPISPSPISPSYSTYRSSVQAPTTYSYRNSGTTSKSILKKPAQPQRSSSRSVTAKKIQFENSPTVYCVTPIENKNEYYGGYVKMSREERRWGPRS